MFESFFAFINNTRIGAVPLDSLLHFLVGMIISILGLRYNYRLINILVFLIIIGIMKELNDYFFAYKVHFTAYLFDILASLVYIPIIFFIRKLKNFLYKKEIETKHKLKY